jgi:hypothetical protein
MLLAITFVASERSDPHGAALLGLKSPHESRCGIGQRVDHVQLVAEAVP